jgi:hypothetical protein
MANNRRKTSIQKKRVAGLENMPPNRPRSVALSTVNEGYRKPNQKQSGVFVILPAITLLPLKKAGEIDPKYAHKLPLI